MVKRLYEIIRDAIDASPVLTQRGLAQRMGLNPAAVNRMLHGRRNIMAEEIPVIESYLGIKLTVVQSDILYHQNATSDRKGFSDVPSAHAPCEDAALLRVPVYGLPLADKNIIDWVPRHPAQFGVRDAFAIYISSGDMEPRYFKGELVYIHPHRPPTEGKDCLVVSKNNDVSVRRLLSSNASSLKTEQYNPQGQKSVSLKETLCVYAIVGRS